MFLCFLCSGAPTTKSQHCGRIRHEFGSHSLNSCRSWRTKSKYSSLTLVISYVRVLHIVFHLTLWPKKESLLQINELSNIWMIISFWMLGDDVEYVDINRWFTLTRLWDFYLKHFIQSMVFLVVQNMVKGSLWSWHWKILLLSPIFQSSIESCTYFSGTLLSSPF